MYYQSIDYQFAVGEGTDHSPTENAEAIGAAEAPAETVRDVPSSAAKGAVEGVAEGATQGVPPYEWPLHGMCNHSPNGF